MPTTVQNMNREDFIRHHTQQTIERGYQIGLFERKEKEVIIKGEKRLPENIRLRGKTGIERRIERCVIVRRQKYGKWPKMSMISSSLHMPAESIIDIILKSEVLDYTTPSSPQRSNFDAVMHWSIELKEVA